MGARTCAATHSATHSDSTVPRLVEHRGEAMGSSLHIVVVGDGGNTTGLLDWAVGRVDELEQRWSRFISSSEISMLNTSPGEPMVVSDDTLTLVQFALEARELSGGRFDPTLLQAMQANGYDRTFVSIKMPVGLPMLDPRRIGLGHVAVDSATNTITLGSTTGFDPGGIGKGLATDLVAEEMIARGALGALVNIGGDVRCIGRGPADGAWVIAVGDHIAGVQNQTVALSEGAVATSTTRRRRWQRSTPTGVVEAHHLLDPATGRPATAAANLVTVIAARCADAEWIATAIAAAGTLDSAPVIAGDAAVMFTDNHGCYSSSGEPERFLQ